MTVAVFPIRSFAGLTRLSSALGERERAALVRTLAERVIAAAAGAGASAAVVTADDAVRAWGVASGLSVVGEPVPGGLDAAAGAGVAAANGPWLIVHADLPAVTSADIAAAIEVVGLGGTVIAPSHDGGTSLIGGVSKRFPFSYGVGSFRRHLAAAPKATTLVRPGLALDLDGVRDLEALEALGLF